MPQPVTLSKLRKHFKESYLLEDDQIEIMILSSSKSIIKVLKDSEIFLDAIKNRNSGGEGPGDESCRKFFHSLKGLFLNMGEEEWASYARELEMGFRKLSYEDLLRNITEIRTGMAELVGYSNN